MTDTTTPEEHAVAHVSGDLVTLSAYELTDYQLSALAEAALRELLDRGAVLMLAEAALDTVARVRAGLDPIPGHEAAR